MDYRLTTMIQKELRRLYSKLVNCLFFVLFRIRNTLGQLTFKHQCILCQETSTKRLCQPCSQQFLYSPNYRCTCCGLPLSHSAIFCGECLQHTPAFDRTFSPYIYQPPLSELIVRFKQKKDFFVGKALADIFAAQIKNHCLQQHLPLPDLITPTPLHWKKRSLRGFNQAAFFTDTISRQLNIPVFKDISINNASLEQKNLSRKQRLNNLKNNISITSNLNGEHIAIVDDVMTTGATANALATALKKAGASKVTVWVLARTPKEALQP